MSHHPSPGHHPVIGPSASVLRALAATLVWLPGLAISAIPLADWDFTTGTHGWTGNRMVGKFAVTPDGLAVTSLGDDPWLEGPPFDAPADALLRVTVEMRSHLHARRPGVLRKDLQRRNAARPFPSSTTVGIMPTPS